MIGFKTLSKLEGNERFLFDKDGLPTRGNMVAPLQRLTKKTELLVSTLGSNPSTPPDEEVREKSALTGQLQLLSEQVECIERMGKIFQDDMDRVFNQQATRAAISEAHSTRRLAVLATIFLPMSLATGVLSMQNRLRDTHLVLWDFLGISI